MPLLTNLNSCPTYHARISYLNPGPSSHALYMKVAKLISLSKGYNLNAHYNVSVIV